MAEVLVVDYQPAWPGQFARVEAELRAVLPPAAPVVEHIGSTAVPGLCAKPVLDIALGVGALAEIDAWIAALAQLGFGYRPGYEAQIPDRRYFVREAGNSPRVHLHGLVLDGRLWRQHLQFRNALRRDPALSAAYAALKRQLADTHAHDKAAYTDAKGPFIGRVLGLPGAVGDQ